MLRWFVRLTGSILVAAILLSFIPVDAVFDALRRTRPLVWGASLLIFLGGHFVNALKLRLLIGASSAPLALIVRAHYAGQAANLGLPGVAGGDLVRAAYLVPSLGTARVALASMADRAIDTAAVVLLIAIALPFAGIPPTLQDAVRLSSWWLGGLAAAGVLGGAALLWLRPHEGLARAIDRTMRSLAERRGAIALAAVMSLGVQSLFVLTNVWLAREVGVTTGLAAWFVAWPLAKLIAILPISLGGLGVREAALVSLLTPFGAPREAVLASGVLWQAVLAASGLLGLIATQSIRRAHPAVSVDVPTRKA